MENITEIISKSLNAFDQNWFNTKKREFESSKYINDNKDTILIEMKRSWDDEVFAQDCTEDEDIIEIWEFSLYDYCVLLGKIELFLAQQFMIDSIREPIKYGYSVEESADYLAKKVFDFIKNIEFSKFREFLNNVRNQLVLRCELMNNSNDITYLKVLNAFIKYYEFCLKDYLRNHLDLESYLLPNDEKLKFDLNKDQFTALIKVLMDGKILLQNEDKIKEFVEKHFLFKPQGKDYTFLPKEKFIAEINRHDSPTYSKSGREKILEKIFYEIKILEKKIQQNLDKIRE